MECDGSRLHRQRRDRGLPRPCLLQSRDARHRGAGARWHRRALRRGARALARRGGRPASRLDVPGGVRGGRVSAHRAVAHAQPRRPRHPRPSAERGRLSRPLALRPLARHAGGASPRRAEAAHRRGSGMRRAVLVLCAALLVPAPRAGAAERVKVGLLKFATNGPTFIALEKGYFAEQGIDASLVYFDAAQPIAGAAVSSDIDVGVTGVAAGFYKLAGKGALAIIAAQSREEPGYANNAILISNHAWDAGLRAYKALGGHSVAVTTIGSPTHYAIGVIADKEGVRLDSSASCRCKPTRTRSRRWPAARSILASSRRRSRSPCC